MIPPRADKKCKLKVRGKPQTRMDAARRTCAADLVGSEGSRDGDGGGRRDCLKALWRALQFLQIFISWPPLPPRPHGRGCRAVRSCMLGRRAMSEGVERGRGKDISRNYTSFGGHHFGKLSQLAAHAGDKLITASPR